MGQEVWLYPEQSKVNLLKDYLSLIGEKDDDYNWIQGPDYNCLEFTCYIQWIDTKKYDDGDLKYIDEILQIGYNSHLHNAGWAKCIAFEIKKRYTILKAGWDSVGWSKQFWDNEPFDFDIQFREETVKKSKDTEVKTDLQEEINDLKCIKKLCCEFAKEMFLEADKKFPGTIPIQ